MIIVGDVRSVHLGGRGQVAAAEWADGVAASRLRWPGGGALKLQDGEILAGEARDGEGGGGRGRK